MNGENFESFLKLQKIEYKIQEPMCKHTSFKIGGPASFFISVKNTDELCSVFKACKEFSVPYFILGKGSNLLVSDKGIKGAVISLLKMDEVIVDGDEITAKAGASLANVCIKALENSLTGLEFAYGIPGSIGGALYMNAGAYGGEMSQVVVSCEYVDANGEKGTFQLEDMKLGYRKSIFCGSKMVITSVKLKLKKGEKADIRAAMDDFMDRRKSKQPLEYPSAGSTFKRPEGYFAGALIEKNNLKGVSVGGAMVSEKHAGFVINFDKATCEDVKGLIKKVQDTVLKADGVTLETEVIFVGEE